MKNFRIIANSNFKSERGTSLIIVIIIIVSLGLLGLLISRLVISETRIAIIDEDKSRAFYIAEAGIEYTVAMISDSVSWRGTSSDISAGNGAFSVVVDDSSTIASLGDTLLATVVGKSPQFSKTLQARLLADNYGWGNAVTAGDIIDFNPGKGTINGNMHANTSATVARRYTINGSVTEAPPVLDMPVVNWAFFQNEAQADSQYFTTDLHFSLAGSPYNGVWYTTQNLIFEDNSIIVYGTLVAEGNMEILKNNVEITATPHYYPAILCGADLSVYFNNTIINGFVYAEEDVTIDKNNGNFNGALFAGGSIQNLANNAVFTLDPHYLSGLVGVELDTTNFYEFPPEIISWQEK